MRPSIYFHIDELARDAVVASNLRRIFGPDVELVYGNRQTSAWLDQSGRAFDLCIMPSVDFLATYWPEPKRMLQTVILPAEQIMNSRAASNDRIVAKFLGSYPDKMRPWVERVSVFLFWGPGAMAAVLELRPDLEPKCHVVGHPRFDYRCLGKR